MLLKTPELLAPAGSLAMLDTAFGFGATAIYAGQPRYSLRVRNNDFGDLPVLADGIKRARAQGKRFYVVANIFPHGAKIKTFLKDIAPVIALQPDALIMSDPGLILMVRENWPDMPIHLSVQANTVNAAAVRFWKMAGVSRVILSRELSLDEIASIRQDCPDMELEVFIHGALHGAGGLHPRRPVHCLLGPLPAVWLLQPSRPQSGQLYQLVPLGLQDPRSQDLRRRRRASD